MKQFEVIKQMIPAWALILIVSAGCLGCVSAKLPSFESFSLKKTLENFTKKDRETDSPEDDSPKDRAIAVVPADNGAPEDQSRIALVVGNSKYRYVSPLANPRNDAKDMRQALKRMGFQVQYLFNAPDDKSIARAVKKFGERLSRKQNTVGLFFYAGHAVQVNGTNYLIPVNAKIRDEVEVKFDTFNVNQLLATLDQAGNDFNIVILDACRDNPFKGLTRSASRGLAQMISPQGCYIAFATAPGSTAEDGRGRNGTFTKHLLKHIQEPGINIEEMFKRVRRSVIAETHNRQRPWTGSDFSGDFYFGGYSDPLEEVRLEKERLAQKRRELEQQRIKIERLKKEQERQSSAGDAARKRAELEKQAVELELKRLEVQRQLEETKMQQERERLAQQQRELEEERKKMERLKKDLERKSAAKGPDSTAAADAARKRAAELEKQVMELERKHRKLERQRLLQEEQARQNQPAEKEVPMPIIGF